MTELDLAGADALLLLADTERNADLYWATGFRAPDPFIYLAGRTGTWVVVKDLELDRARQTVRGTEVLAHSAYEKGLGPSPGTDAVLHAVVRDLGLRHLRVPTDFPVGCADGLRAAGFRVDVAPAPLFPQRALKRADEIEAIAAAQAGAEAGMAAAVEVLRRAAIRGQDLVVDGVPLTCETVRRAIHHALLDADCAADHTIVAGGEQAIDPHETGHGPLPAHQPVIVDIFPRHAPTGYFGDITRTFVRGTPSAAAQTLYDTVAAAQALALQGVRGGADGAQVHDAVVQHFVAAGYETGERDGRLQGFFHGTGHGVGLEIHETPRLSRAGTTLAPGHVVTVEPGLYYSGVGGVRIEDLVVVTAEGQRNLTTFPKAFVL